MKLLVDAAAHWNVPIAGKHLGAVPLSRILSNNAKLHRVFRAICFDVEFCTAIIDSLCDDTSLVAIGRESQSEWVLLDGYIAGVEEKFAVLQVTNRRQASSLCL